MSDKTTDAPRTSAATLADQQDKQAGNDTASSLGQVFVAARERRGLTREEVINQTHLPEHYVRMMEGNDYSRISDQLYLLPFLRRYAVFLEMDPEETAMRFIREVQRADNNPPVRMAQPLIEASRHRRASRFSRTKMLVAAAAAAVIAGAYLFERHRGSEITTTSSLVSPASNPAPAQVPMLPAPAASH